MSLAGTRVLVTGGAGFIGSHLARRVLAQGGEVVVVDDLSNGRRENAPPGATLHVADLRDPTTLDLLGDEPFDAVFHLAAQSSGALSFADPEADFTSHAPVVFNLLRWCQRTGVRRFLYASSTTIYGEPETLPVAEDHPVRPKTYYGAGKAAGERYVALFSRLGLDTTVFRLPNVYGPGQNLANLNQGMISIYLAYLLRGEPILVAGSPARFRDFLHIDDLADAWMAALTAEATFGRTFNLATGRATTVAEVLDHLRRAAGRPDHPVTCIDNTPGDQTGVVCDISRIADALGWRPNVDISTGIERLVLAEQGAFHA
jgi:UDP-glucose 4-epimerase